MLLHFYKYIIPFKTPFITAGQTFSNRSGVIALLEKDGSTTLGEAAPLPGFSTESIQDVIQQVRSNIESITQFFRSDFSLSELEDFLKNQNLAPSLQFCLYTLATTHLALVKDQPLQQTLFNNPVDSIAVNAVIDLTQQDILNSTAMYQEKGFNTIKVKAGTDTQKLVAQIQRIREVFPEIQIRLDANQSWSLNQAIDLFTEIEDFNIEYCEEPLFNPGQDELLELKNRTSVPIALDESLVHALSLTEAATLADALIIKPMVHGPVIETLKEISNQTNAKIVFTSSLENAIGRLMTATLAAGLGTADTAHGLATGGLLAEDLWNDDDFINNGRYTLPGPEKLTTLMKSPLSGITTKRLNIE